MGAGRGRVLVVGSVNVDHVIEADVFPAPGETVIGRSMRTAVGGKGGNQAVAATRVGADVGLLARVGDDDAGRTACAALAAAGVDIGGVLPVADIPTGTAWITVAEHDNTIVVLAAANGSWPADWPDERARTQLAAADVVLLQLEVPLAIVEAAAAAGGRVVLNAAPAVPLPDTLIASCDVLVVNEHEQVIVAGCAAVDEAHARLRARGVGAVITTLGARGAVVTSAVGTLSVPAPAADVVDTTGAGDAFAGVLCARLAAGDELSAATRWAVAAGSLSVQRRGTHDSYPDMATISTLVT